MLEILRKIGRLRIVAMTALVILLPFLAYYFIYVSTQTGYYTDRNFRILANFSGSVKERVEGLRTVSVNAARAAVKRAGGGGRAVDITQAALREDFSATLKVVRAEGTNLTAIAVRPADSAEPSQDNSSARSSVSIGNEDGHMGLYFGTDLREDEKGGDRQGERAVGATPTVWHFESETSINDALGTIAVNTLSQEHKSSEHEGGFDILLISETDGDARVFYQQSTTGFLLTNMTTLASADDDSKKISLGDLGRYTNAADVKFAGTNYKLFVQPIELNISTRGENKPVRLAACGLVQSNHFRHETWAIPPTILILFGFLMALVVLSWPFFKLLTIGPKDRVRSVDVYLLGFSTFLTLSLLTFFFLYLYAYPRLDAEVNNEVNGQLKMLAESIQSNFTEELQLALAELKHLNETNQLEETAFRHYQQDCLDQKSNLVTKSQRDKCNLAILTNLRPKYLPTLLNPTSKFEPQLPHPYLYFHTVSWIDQNGQQAVKWTVRSQPTNPINVSYRQYFRDIQARKLLPLDSYRFALEPIISETTGSNEVIIATPAAPARPNWISALNVHLLSVMQAVVPAGYGFAIIDESGKVLFHSDGINHFGENFFVECDDNRLLRSAVIGHAAESINVHYLGQGHSIYVRPFGTMPWAIVTFNSKEYLRTSISEVLTLCLLLFLFYSLFLLVLFAAIFIVNRETDERSSWLWPDPRRALTYFVMLVALAVFIGFSFLLTWLGGRMSFFPAWLSILMPFIAPALLSLLGLGMFVFFMKKTQPFAGLRGISLGRGLIDRLPDSRRLYILSVTALFVLTSIVPAYGCFKLAYDEELRLLVKEGQVSLAKGLAARDDRVRSQYTPDMFPGAEERLPAFIADRLDQKLDVYSHFFFGTEVILNAEEHNEGEAENNLIGFFKSYVPLFNQTSVERQAYVRAKSADDLWRWETQGSDGLVLHTKVGSRQDAAKEGFIHIISKIPRMNYAPFWPIAFPMLCLVTLLLLRFIIRRIFLLNLACGSLQTVRKILDLAGSQNMFLVMTPPCLGEEDEYTLQGYCVINFQDYIGNSNGAGADPARPEDGSEVVIIENFGYRPDSPELNMQRLLLLERFQRQNIRVIALSALDPEDYAFAADNGTAQPATHNRPWQEDWHWVNLMAHFVKLNVADRGDERLLEHYLMKARRRLSPPGSPRSRVKRVEKILESIREECGVSAGLQQIGVRLASDEDLLRADEWWVVDRVLEQAGVFYRWLYDNCSDSERLTLFHLAQDHMVGPKDPDVRRLFRRGLIIRAPDVKLMNNSFRLYVLAKGKSEGLDRRETQPLELSNWESLKFPLGIAIACVILFLFVTQRDIYNSTLAVVTAITAGIPSIFKLLDLLQRDAGTRAPASRST